MKHLTTVTQEGVTLSQPGVCASVMTGCGKCVLHVSRAYEVRNVFGGVGVHKPLDCDGMEFDTSEQAWSFALARGYVRRYYTSRELRARRVKEARRPGQALMPSWSDVCAA